MRLILRSHHAWLGMVAMLLPCLHAASFPKPYPEKTFPELKLDDAEGRPWRAAREDWAGAKQRVASDPAWAKWLAMEKAAVDRWSAHNHDRVAWVCGWWHDFVSPKDGSYLTWTDEIPGEQAAFLHSPSDPHVEITPKILGGWVFGFRSRHAEMIRRAARLYRLTGEQRYAEWAAAQLDFYANHLSEWPVSSRGARLYWQTLDEATNCVLYVDAVRLLGDFAPADRRAVWRTKFFNPTVDLLDRTMQTIHNIATWQRCAAAEVALVFHDDALWHEALDGRYGLRRQIAEGVTSDYLWYEQSLGYNSYVVHAVLTLFTIAGIEGRAGELADEMAVTENLMLAPLYLRMPDGHTPNPADSTSVGTAPDRMLYSEAYRVFPTTLGVEVAAARHDWETLLDPPPAVRGPVSLPPVKSWDLETSRMTLLKRGDWEVFFHYGQLTRSHAQSEALNYTMYFGATDVSHDPGTVGYGSPLHQEYYTQGLNHNVPLIDGEGEEPPQRGELVRYSESTAQVTASQPHYRRNARATRDLQVNGAELVDTTSIETTDGPHRLGMALHLQGAVTLPSAFTPSVDFASGRPAAFRYWRDVTSAAFHDAAEFDVRYASGLVLHVTIAAPGEFRIWHGSAPDVPPRRRDAFYLEMKEPATAARFTTRFQAGR